MTRGLIIAATVVVAAVLFVVLRPDDDDEPSATTTTTQTNPTTDREPTVPPPRPPSPPPPARVRITVRDGRPVGGIRRVTVGRGRRIVLTVSADVSDHVHLHGYNVFRDVAPGRPARIAFRATILGTVEVELEERRIPVATVTVQP
jgi:hypothetical protein